MKNSCYILALSFMTLVGCRDACTDTECFHGGYCADASCHCPEPFSGISCLDQRVPERITIRKVRLESFPYFNDGESWDQWGNPDVGIRLRAEGKEFASDVVENVAEYQACEYAELEVDISDPEILIRLDVFEWDEVESEHVATMECTLYNEHNGYPASVRVKNNVITAVFYLEYSFE